MTKKSVAKTTRTTKEVAVTTTVNTFEVLFENTKTSIRETDEAVKKLEDMLSKAKNKQSELNGELRRLKAVRSLSAYSEENAPYKWKVEKWEANTYQKYAWKELHRYSTASYAFCATITERTDLKKFKWEISLSGSKVSYKYKDSYTEHSYVKDHAKDWNVILENKYSSEAEARQALEIEKEKLINAHRTEIAAEQELVKDAKLMPRIEVGSIVEHSYWGRGEVVSKYNDYNDGRWNVLFDRAKERLGDTARLQTCDEDNLKLIK